MKLGRVAINVGYVVDLDNQSMVEHAKQSILEDIMDGDCWISTHPVPDAKIKDIPDFLTSCPKCFGLSEWVSANDPKDKNKGHWVCQDKCQDSGK